jgi:hypothetical protein
MLDLKKDIANEIAYLVAQNELTKISKLHKSIHHLYGRAKIPTFSCHIGFEKAFIFVAAKHIFKIDLSKSKLFHNIADSENLYHFLLQDSSLYSLLHQVNEKGLMRLLFLNINHAECKLINNEEMKKVNLLIARHAQAKDELKHITKMYVGYKIMQDVHDGKILNASEKEIEKLNLSDFFGVPAPPDEEILRTFGWRKLPVPNETLSNIFRIIPEKP